MPRWTGTWIERLGSTGERPDDGSWPGRRLGLPREGRGAVASSGRRAVAWILDAAASALIAALFIADPVDPRRNLLSVAVLTLDYLLLASLTGQTFGMRLLGVRLVRLADRDAPPGFLPVTVRTALLLLLIPAVVTDRDGRGLHDQAAGTVAVRA